MDDKRVVKFKKDNQDVEIYIKNPSLSVMEEGDSIRLKARNKAIKDEVIFAEGLGKLLRDQGIWTDAQDQLQLELQDELILSTRKLKKGGIKKSEARQIAIRIRQIKEELRILAAPRIKYVNDTVEGISQNKEFAYRVSQVAVYNSNRDKKYFVSYEDYLNRINDWDAYIISSKAAEIFYSSDSEEYLPENEFLKRFGYVDDKLRLINSDGHLIDSEGKLVDEFGNYVIVVDNKDVVVDKDGNVLPEVSVGPAVYLDDDGNPIEENKPSEPAAT